MITIFSFSLVNGEERDKEPLIMSRTMEYITLRWPATDSGEDGRGFLDWVLKWLLGSQSENATYGSIYGFCSSDFSILK